ncbi:hypothetical protein Caci_7668 [Catenulispora acidiphila DSM 44928]|uniref:DUF1508 domain-containing protein n=1 Tax=Catenulispora acidiphila (strain DSM 44928 / JCM 14897 / NBRC 102108 / NRRL B-24433 / ID139908) TaxID=479433 RepID=C7QCM9_CATAD|nr:hypothetical protein [Catenulispora acidiphila]ACU76492.1 hypothetical protein Caci_7668 [Catenulispora acidiphila DSM 44928]
MPAALVVRSAQDGELTWVLLAANGRPLARSASAYRTDEALVAAWRELVVDRDALSIRLGRDGSGPDWWWTAALPARSTGGPGGRGRRGGTGPGDGAVVARSARGYLRPDQCRSGASGFLSALSGFSSRLR